MRVLARFAAAAALAGCWFAPLAAAPPRVAPLEGLRRNTPAVHALRGARIIPSPGKEIPAGVIVLRDGRIEAVGPDVEIPADAKVWDCTGCTIYPGLIDAYGQFELPAEKPAVNHGYWNPFVAPHRRAEEHDPADSDRRQKLRSQGFTARLIAPSGGILKGTSAVVGLSDEPPPKNLIHAPAALHVRITVPRPVQREIYPNSPMGAFALVRQSLHDALWYAQAQPAAADHPAQAPEHSPALARLAELLAAGTPAVIDAPDAQYALRAGSLAQEFPQLRLVLRGSGKEYQRVAAIAGLNVPLLVPINFPQPPDVRTPEDAMNVTLARLLDWDLAPENPARLAAAGVRFALTTDGLKDPATFLAQVRKAVARGLDAPHALAAVTSRPAEILGVAAELGTIEPGKRAHLVLTDGDLFAERTRILETWIDGARHEIQP